MVCSGEKEAISVPGIGDGIACHNWDSGFVILSIFDWPGSGGASSSQIFGSSVTNGKLENSVHETNGLRDDANELMGLVVSIGKRRKKKKKSQMNINYNPIWQKKKKNKKKKKKTHQSHTLQQAPDSSKPSFEQGLAKCLPCCCHRPAVAEIVDVVVVVVPSFPSIVVARPSNIHMAF